MADNAAEILFRLGVESTEGKKAFNDFVSSLVRGLKQGEQGFRDFESLTAKTSKVLEEAAQAGETYVQKHDRQVRERIAAVKLESDQVGKAIRAIKEQTLARIADDERLTLETAKNERERAAIRDTFRNKREAAEKASDDAVRVSRQKTQKALDELEKKTGVKGALKGVVDDLAASAAAGTLSINDFTAAIGKAVSALGPYGQAALLATAGIVALTRALVEYSKQAAVYVREQDAIQKATGASAETVAGASLAFKQVGASAQDVSDVIAQVAQQATAAAAGNVELQQTFTRLGVSMETIRAGDINKILAELDANFNRIPSSIQKTTDTAKVFGEQGSRQFAAVAGSLAKFNAVARDTGLVVDKDTKRAVAEFGRASGELDAQITALTTQLGLQFLPTLKEIIPPISDAFAAVNQFVKANPQVLDGIKELASIIGAGLAEAIRIIPPLFAQLNQAVEGFYEVVIGAVEVIDIFAGALSDLANGGFVSIFKALAQAATGDLGGAFQTIQSGFKQTFSEAKQAGSILGDGLNKLFGGDVPAATKQTTKAIEETTSATKTLSAVAQQSAQSLKELQSTHQADLALVQQSLDAQIEAGTVTRKEAAAATLAVVQDQAAKELEALQAKINAERDLYAEGTSQRIAAENEFSTQYAAIQGRILESQKALNAEAAKVRDEARSETLKQAELDQKEFLNQVAIDEEQHTLTHASAEAKRYQASADRLDKEKALIQQQLAEENVGADERKRLTDRLTEIARESDSLRIDSARARIEAEIADEREALEATQALTDQKVAQQQILINQAKERGDDALRIAQLEEDALQLQLATLKEVISGKQAQGASDAELIQLETQRIQLEEELRIKHREVTGEVVAGQGEQAAAIRETAGAIGETKGKLGELGQTAREAVGAVGASFDPKSFDQLDAAIKQVQTNIQNLRALGFGALAGPYEAQLQDLFKRRDDIIREQDAKDSEARRAAAEKEAAERLKAEEDLARDRAKVEEDHAREMAELRDRQVELDKERLKEVAKVEKENLDRIAEAEREASDARVRREEDEARRILQVKEDLERSQEDARLSADERALEQEADFISKRGDLEAQLSTATADGDTEGAAKAQKELDRLSEDEALAAERKAAEDEARQAATSEEELKILLDAVEKRFSLKQEEIDRVRELEDKGRTAEAEALKANFEKRRALVEEQRRVALQRLAERLAEEERLRQEAAAKEEQEALDRIEKEKTDAAERLANLKASYDEKQKDIDDALAAEKASYDQAAADIEKRTQELGAKITDALKPAIDALKQVAGGAGAGAGGGGGTGGGPGGGGGTRQGGGSPGGPGSGGSGGTGGGGSGSGQRRGTPPPTPPPPKPSPPPTPQTPTGGQNPFGAPKTTADKEFSRQGKPFLAQATGALSAKDPASASSSIDALNKLFGDYVAAMSDDFRDGAAKTIVRLNTQLAGLGGGTGGGGGTGTGLPDIQTGGPGKGIDAASIGGGVKGTGETITTTKPGGGTTPGTGAKPPATKTFDAAKDSQSIPTVGQLLLQRVQAGPFKGGITAGQAKQEWDAAVAQNPALAPYTKAFYARLEQQSQGGKEAKAGTVGGSTSGTEAEEQAARERAEKEGKGKTGGDFSQQASGLRDVLGSKPPGSTLTSQPGVGTFTTSPTGTTAAEKPPVVVNVGGIQGQTQEQIIAEVVKELEAGLTQAGIPK